MSCRTVTKRSDCAPVPRRAWLGSRSCRGDGGHALGKRIAALLDEVARGDLDPVAAAFLGVVERLVGLGQQFLQIEWPLRLNTMPMLKVAATG